MWYFTANRGALVGYELVGESRSLANRVSQSNRMTMLTFTERAREMVRSYMDESEGELTALRIDSGDATPGRPSWELTLVADDEWEATDVEVETADFTVLVERNVAGLLEGATVDYVDQGGRVGFQINTVAGAVDGGDTPAGSVASHSEPALGGPESPSVPTNASEGASPGPASAASGASLFEAGSAPHAPPPTEEERIAIQDPPKGPMADRIRELLDTRINPAVAMHGGHIGLADVRDGEIFIVMSGGCQGCALSRMTLRQGVERMIRQELPDVKTIHDVTDHKKGDNPYYDAPIG